MATILALDDDRQAQDTLRDLLENLGHEVHLAANVDGALRLARYRVPFDLAVMDTRTVRKAGAERAALLAAAWPTLPVLLAGDDAGALADAASASRATNTLTKPFGDAVGLEREIARALSRTPEQPRAAGPASAEAAEPAADGGPVVLVAEDNDILRGAMVRVLRGAGLTVLEAESGDHALRAAARPGRIDLLVTDVVMPGLTGTELADRLAQDRPALKVLFVSGYPSEASVASAGRRSAVLEKPFRHATLLENVRRLLA